MFIADGRGAVVAHDVIDDAYEVGVPGSDATLGVVRDEIPFDQVMSAVTSKRALPYGYSFQIDARKASFRDVAEWVELERKCCPFFVFELGMKGEDGSVWLNLRGRDGVKQFIEADFKVLFDHLP